MAKSRSAATSLTDAEKVTAYISALDPAQAEAVEAIRQCILDTSPGIGEQIKWNAPSFYYTGDMKPFDPQTYRAILP